MILRIGCYTRYKQTNGGETGQPHHGPRQLENARTAPTYTECMS